MKYIVEKGFIAIDGISLTVISRDASAFSISVIPFTLAHTNLGYRQSEDQVNIEVDIVAKYVDQLVGSYVGKS
jgi:riboflavin synthase